MKYTDIGRCYTFNSLEVIDTKNRTFASNQPGAKYNLALRLYANQDEYFYGPYASPGFKVPPPIYKKDIH